MRGIFPPFMRKKFAEILAATTAVWGSITGTLSDQTDLQSALDGKSDTGHTHLTSEVTEDTQLYFTNERAQDAIGGILLDSTFIDFTYDDATPTITAIIISGSVTETQLNTSVNASLDLADSSVQPGDNVSDLVNDAGYITSTLSQEQVEDYVGAMFTGNTESGITSTYDDPTGKINLTVSLAGFSTSDLSEGTNLYYTDERAQDGVGGILVDSSHIDFTYNDVTPSITASIIAGSVTETELNMSVNASLDLADSSVQPGDNISTLTNDAGYITATLTQEQVEDYAGALVANATGTHTGITITYQDATGDIDFVVDHDAATNFVANEHINHTSVTLTAGTGLTGGGDISANRSFALSAASIASLALADSATQPGDNVSSLTNDAGYITATLTQEQVEDYAGNMIANVTGTHTGITVTYQDVTGDMDFVVDHDAATNFVADEHVAHSSITISAGTGLTGGGTIAANRSIALSAASIASLALADSSIQPGDGVSTLTNDAGYITATLTQEQVEDYAGGLVARVTGTHTGITITYQDATGDMDFVVDHDAATNFVADEHVAHSSITISAGTGLTGGGTIAANRSIALSAASIASLALADSATQPGDGVSTLTNDAGYITATLTQEQVEDYVGAMVSGNTETGIAVTYDDINGKLNFVLDTSGTWSGNAVTATTATTATNASNVAGSGVSGAYTSCGMTLSTARLLGRTTAGSGAAEEITVGTGLSLSGGSLTATASENSNPNLVINGEFRIFQRGSTFSIGGSAAYTADRWEVPAITAGSGTLDVSVQGGDVSPYCLRFGRSSGATFTNICFVTQALESLFSVPLQGETLTLTFRARKGSNYSATSDYLYSSVMTGTGTDEGMSNGQFTTGNTDLGSQANTLTTSWQTFEQQVTVGSSVNQVGLRFYYTPVGTAGAADYAEIEMVKLEVGSVATKNIPRQMQEELALCQRYYSKTYDQGTNPGTATENGMNANRQSATTFLISTAVRFPVEMRTVPTMTIYSPTTGTAARVRNLSAGTDLTYSSMRGLGSGGYGGINLTSSPSDGTATGWHHTADAEL